MAKKKPLKRGATKKAPVTTGSNKATLQKAPTKQVARKKAKYISPVKKIKSVREDIKKLRSPIYALNRKIKNAPTRYYANKFKKQRKIYLAENESVLNKLVETRTTLKSDIKLYKKNLIEKKQHQSNLAKIRRKIKKADEEQDYDEVNRLTYDEISELGKIDKLNGKLGAIQDDIFDKDKYNRDEQPIEENWLLDFASPYSIFEAKAQLTSDIESGEFRYIYIDGVKYSGKDDMMVMIAASADYWLNQRKQYSGTPYYNRYLKNLKKSIDVKWDMAYS